MDVERPKVYLRHFNPWKSGVSGGSGSSPFTPFIVTFDRLGRSGEVLQEKEESVTFKTGQKDIQEAVRGSVPPWPLGNEGANPHGSVFGHKAKKNVTGSSQHGLTKLAKDKSGLINLIAL